ncbi:unnamed protein product [Urochloa humidicola]
MKSVSSLLATRRWRLLLAGLAAAFPLLFAVRRVAVVPDEGFTLPAPVAEALLHYAASPDTPQLTRAELSLAARAIMSRAAPRNLLVFGLGRDTALWAALNHGAGGRTVFLEEDPSWIADARAAHPPGLGLEAYHVAYDTVLADAGELLRLRDDPACVARPDCYCSLAE